MTFSIVAHDAEENAWGVAVASKFLAVGSVVGWARAGVGAVATQAFANVTYGPRGLELMGQGLSAEETLARLLAEDEEREHRQVGVVDAQGRAAAHSGAECFEWAGHHVGEGYTCQGNILTGAEVVQAMARAFEKTRGPLEDRLYAALVAGEQAGGDRRGKQSAAILVVKPNGGYGGNNDLYLDLRVDDDAEPVARLGELLTLHKLYFGSPDPNALLPIEGELARELKGVLARLGYYDGAVDDRWDKAAIEAFWAFVGTENLEERWTPDDAHRIDPVVVDYIRGRFGGK